MFTSGAALGSAAAFLVLTSLGSLAWIAIDSSGPAGILGGLADSGLRDVLTNEVVAQEVVRTLVGSLGLVAAVPVTTLLAAVTVRVERPGRTPRPEVATA